MNNERDKYNLELKKLNSKCLKTTIQLKNIEHLADI